jgi:hypothetical protein
MDDIRPEYPPEIIAKKRWQNARDIYFLLSG